MILSIEKLIYGGDGLARLPQDEHGPGKSVFVPFVLEGERVEAEVVEEKAGFARAHLSRVLEASRQRIPPGCPYFGKCGGCQYQHTDYEAQLLIKERILRETFFRIAKRELPANLRLHPSPPWNYRNRTRMRLRVSAACNGRREKFVLGYNRFRSAQILPVRKCPISSPLINQAIEALWKLGEGGRVPAGTHEVQWFADDQDQRLLVELVVSREPQKLPAQWKQFARSLREALPQISGIAVFDEVRRGRTARLRPRRAEEAEFGVQELLYRAAGNEYRVSAGSFFQINRFLADELVNVITEGASGRRALDLYAGVGLFSLPLARKFEQVTAVEMAGSSFWDLRRNVPANVSAQNVSVEAFLARPQKHSPFDYVVVDPPRAGLGEGVTRRLGALGAPVLAYVSCDPATLARDARILLDLGYRIEQVHLLDLFPQTFHMESVLRLRR
jgi:23S rRNA (uracil1939-C5)-methyltransferase